MSEAPQADATFMVFNLEGALVGVPTAAVESVLADPERPAASASSNPLFAFLTEAAPRLLILGSRSGQPAPVVRAAGGVRVASLASSQVVDLPRLCRSPGSAIVGVALDEEQVLFLILDPYRLAGNSAETRTPSSCSEESP